MLWKNGEGYADATAAVAIRCVEKERKKMAKRNCRRSMDENKAHDKAVKMRKMTDIQLVEYIENRVEKARSEGRNETKREKSLKEFFASLSFPGVIPGVGQTTVDKLRRYAEEGGYLG